MSTSLPPASPWPGLRRAATAFILLLCLRWVWDLSGVQAAAGATTAPSNDRGKSNADDAAAKKAAAAKLLQQRRRRKAAEADYQERRAKEEAWMKGDLSGELRHASHPSSLGRVVDAEEAAANGAGGSSGEQTSQGGSGWRAMNAEFRKRSGSSGSGPSPAASDAAGAQSAKPKKKKLLHLEDDNDDEEAGAAGVEEHFAGQETPFDSYAAVGKLSKTNQCAACVAYAVALRRAAFISHPSAEQERTFTTNPKKQRHRALVRDERLEAISSEAIDILMSRLAYVSYIPPLPAVEGEEASQVVEVYASREDVPEAAEAAAGRPPIGVYWGMQDLQMNSRLAPEKLDVVFGSKRGRGIGDQKLLYYLRYAVHEPDGELIEEMIRKDMIDPSRPSSDYDYMPGYDGPLGTDPEALDLIHRRHGAPFKFGVPWLTLDVYRVSNRTHLSGASSSSPRSTAAAAALAASEAQTLARLYADERAGRLAFVRPLCKSKCQLHLQREARIRKRRIKQYKRELEQLNRLTARVGGKMTPTATSRRAAAVLEARIAKLESDGDDAAFELVMPVTPWAPHPDLYNATAWRLQQQAAEEEEARAAAMEEEED